MASLKCFTIITLVCIVFSFVRGMQQVLYVVMVLLNGKYLTEGQNRNLLKTQEEGNMFRLNRWWHPIDASNNTKDVFDQDRSDVTFELYGANNTTWNLIGSGAIGENFNTSTNDWRMPTHNDYMVLRKNYETDANEVDYGYGVLYADGATQTADDIVTAYEYRRNSPKTYGMRGCFVYNNKTGANLFFPIGASGYGRIKHGGVNTGEAAKNGYAQEKR